jgi:hypothetical protein
MGDKKIGRPITPLHFSVDHLSVMLSSFEVLAHPPETAGGNEPSVSPAHATWNRPRLDCRLAVQDNGVGLGN